MGIRHHYVRLPAELIGMVREYPEVLQLLGSIAGPRPVSGDLAALLAAAERNPNVLLDYGLLTLPALRAFVGSPLRTLRLRAELGVDKAGYAIHFLLDGSFTFKTTPVADLVPHEELRNLADVADVLVHPEAVALAYQRLCAEPLRALRERFDARGLAEAQVYPEIWDDPTAVDYVLTHYRALAILFGDAVKAGDAIVVSTSI